jgi:hypothetical protein
MESQKDFFPLALLVFREKGGSNVKSNGNSFYANVDTSNSCDFFFIVDERKSRFCEIKNYCDRHYSYEMFVKFV